MALSRSRLIRHANARPDYDHVGIVGNSKIETIAHTSFSGCGSEKMKRERFKSAIVFHNSQDASSAADFLE
jgi:hypothetical protein